MSGISRLDGTAHSRVSNSRATKFHEAVSDRGPYLRRSKAWATAFRLGTASGSRFALPARCLGPVPTVPTHLRRAPSPASGLDWGLAPSTRGGSQVQF